MFYVIQSNELATFVFDTAPDYARPPTGVSFRLEARDIIDPESGRSRRDSFRFGAAERGRPSLPAAVGVHGDEPLLFVLPNIAH